MDFILLRRSINHALTLLLAAGMIICCWLCLRFSYASLMLVNFTYLVASLLYDVKSWTERLKISLQIALFSGILQLLIGMTAKNPFLALLLPGVFNFLLLVSLHNRQAVCIVLLIGHLGYFSESGFMPSVSRMIELLYSAAAVFLATSFAGWVHLRTGYETLTDDPFSPAEALGMSLAMMFGTFLMHILQFSQNAWIVLTITFLYMTDQSKRSMWFYASRRLFAVPLGLFCGFLFMSCLLYFNATMIYAIPFIGVLTFFVLYWTGSYFWYTVLFMMTFSIYADLSAGTSKAVNLMDFTLARTLATLIGSVIAITFKNYFLLWEETVKS